MTAVLEFHNFGTNNNFPHTKMDELDLNHGMGDSDSDGMGEPDLSGMGEPEDLNEGMGDPTELSDHGMGDPEPGIAESYLEPDLNQGMGEPEEGMGKEEEGKSVPHTEEGMGEPTISEEGMGEESGSEIINNPLEQDSIGEQELDVSVKDWVKIRAGYELTIKAKEMEIKNMAVSLNIKDSEVSTLRQEIMLLERKLKEMKKIVEVKDNELQNKEELIQRNRSLILQSDLELKTKNVHVSTLEMQIREKDAEIRNLGILVSKNTSVEPSSPRYYNSNANNPSTYQLQLLTDRVEKAEKDVELKVKECRLKDEDLKSTKDKNRLLKQTLLDKDRLYTSLEQERNVLEDSFRKRESESEKYQKDLDDQLTKLSKSQAMYKNRSSCFFFLLLILIIVLAITLYPE